MKKRDIRQACEDSGLAVERLEEADQVLVVVPRALDELPAADQLAELGRELCELSGKRYVTLAVDEADPS